MAEGPVCYHCDHLERVKGEPFCCWPGWQKEYALSGLRLKDKTLRRPSWCPLIGRPAASQGGGGDGASSPPETPLSRVRLRSRVGLIAPKPAQREGGPDPQPDSPSRPPIAKLLDRYLKLTHALLDVSRALETMRDAMSEASELLMAFHDVLEKFDPEGFDEWREELIANAGQELGHRLPNDPRGDDSP